MWYIKQWWQNRTDHAGQKRVFLDWKDFFWRFNEKQTVTRPRIDHYWPKMAFFWNVTIILKFTFLTEAVKDHIKFTLVTHETQNWIIQHEENLVSSS